MSDFHHYSLGLHERYQQPEPITTPMSGRFWVTQLDDDGSELSQAQCETPEDLHEALEDCHRNGIEYKIEWFPF